MKQSERFALMEWLTEFPDDKTYDEIILMLKGDESEWTHPDIDVWEVVENHTLDQVADIIENTRMHFESVVDDDSKQIEIDNLKAELKYFYGGGK
jgi:hypothetical protein